MGSPWQPKWQLGFSNAATLEKEGKKKKHPPPPPHSPLRDGHLLQQLPPHVHCIWRLFTLRHWLVFT